MEQSAASVLDLLGNELNRRILRLTSEDPLSADDIADRCDASLPTVYRHIDDLRSADLIAERVEYDAAGNHFKRYRASLDSMTLSLTDGKLTIDVDERDETTPGATVSEPVPDGVEPAGTSGAEDVERPQRGE